MNLLYRLSKSDPVIMERCNNRTRGQQKALGLFVLLTAMFAFISSYYALTTIFGEWDDYSRDYILSVRSRMLVLFCASLFAVMIGAIDREIVSAKNKVAALLRIPLAITIGIVISVPVKLKILEGRINQQINEVHAEKIAPFLDRRENFLSQINEEIGELEKMKTIYIMKRDDEFKRVEAEDLGLSGDGFSGIPGMGIRYRYAQNNVDRYDDEIRQLESQIRDKEDYRDERLAQMQRDFQVYSTNAVYDFWAKYTAMHEIVEQDTSNNSRWMVIGITLLFILLELIPSLMKLLSNKNEYDRLSDYLDKLIQKKLDKSLKESDLDMDRDNPIVIPEITYDYEF